MTSRDFLVLCQIPSNQSVTLSHLRRCPLGGAGGKPIFADGELPDMISEALTTCVENSVTSRNAEPMTSGITCKGIDISIES